MSNQKETAAERIERMRREKEAAKAAEKGTPNLVEQLTHESTGEPDFSALAKKLEERNTKEFKSENDGHVKMTMYIREDVAEAFNALATERGQKKEFANQAIKEFVSKKIKELGL